MERPEGRGRLIALLRSMLVRVRVCLSEGGRGGREEACGGVLANVCVLRERREKQGAGPLDAAMNEASQSAENARGKVAQRGMGGAEEGWLAAEMRRAWVKEGG